MHKSPCNVNELNYPDVFNIKGIRELELNNQIILNELNSYLQKNIFASQFNTTMVENPKSRKVRSLRVWLIEMYDIQKHFTQTSQLLSGIKGVVNIGFNLLEPNAFIKPHYVDTNAIIRCNLGLIIPEEILNCALKVNNEVRNW